MMVSYLLITKRIVKAMTKEVSISSLCLLNANRIAHLAKASVLSGIYKYLPKNVS